MLRSQVILRGRPPSDIIMTRCLPPDWDASSSSSLSETYFSSPYRTIVNPSLETFNACGAIARSRSGSLSPFPTSSENVRDEAFKSDRIYLRSHSAKWWGERTIEAGRGRFYPRKIGWVRLWGYTKREIWFPDHRLFRPADDPPECLVRGRRSYRIALASFLGLSTVRRV